VSQLSGAAGLMDHHLQQPLVFVIPARCACWGDEYVSLRGQRIMRVMGSFVLLICYFVSVSYIPRLNGL
jgi:hypothetical protein